MTSSTTNPTAHVARIVTEAPRVGELLTFLDAGYNFVFAPDFSEIHNYMLPLPDLRDALQKGEPEALQQEMRHWYASKQLLESDHWRTVLLPPYRAELSQKIAFINNSYLQAVSGIDAESGADISSVTKALMDDPHFLQAMEEFENSSDFERAQKLIAFVKGHHKRFVILIEISSHSWGRGLDRLKTLWSAGLLQLSDKVLDVDGQAAIKRGVDYAESIEETRRKNQSRSAYRLNAFIDGWAIEMIRLANLKAIQNPEKNPLVIFVSRSTDMRRVMDKYTLLSSPRIQTPIQCFWNPDTFLAYQIIVQVSAKREEQHKAVEELVRINRQVHNGVWPAKEREDLQTEVKASTLADTVRKHLSQVSLEIENLSLFKASADFEGNALQRSVQTASTYLPTELVGFVRQFLHFVKERQYVLLEACKEELAKLWQTIAEIDNKVFSLRTIGGIIISRSTPKPSIEPINDIGCIRVPISGHSVWIRLKTAEVNKWVRELIDAIERGNSEAGYLTLYERIGGSESFDPEISLLAAILLVCIAKFSVARLHLDSIQTKNDRELKLEVELVRFSIEHLQRTDPKLALTRMHDLLKDYGYDPRLCKAMSVLAWEAFRKMGTEEYLRETVSLAERAYNNVKEKGLFQFECLNNLAYFRTELFLKGLIQLDVLTPMVAELEALSNRLPREEIENGETLHTSGKLKWLIAANTNDVALAATALQELEKASMTITGIHVDLVHHDFAMAQEQLGPLLKMAVR